LKKYVSNYCGNTTTIKETFGETTRTDSKGVVRNVNTLDIALLKTSYSVVGLTAAIV